MKSVYRKTHIQARPGWQRGFLRWLQENRNQFAIRPSVERRNKINLTLCFYTLPDSIREAVRIHIHKTFVQVEAVFHEPLYYDFFCHLRTSVISKLPNGRYKTRARGLYGESYLSDEYDSPESLRRAVLYHPLLDWVNTKLAPARWMAIYPQNRDYGTIIRLLPDASQLALHICDELNKKHNRVCPDASAKENEMQHIIPLKIQAEPEIMQLYQQALVQCSRIYSSNPQRLFVGASSLQRMLHIGYNKACVLRKLFVADQVWQAVETEQDIRYKLCGL